LKNSVSSISTKKNSAKNAVLQGKEAMELQEESVNEEIRDESVPTLHIEDLRYTRG